MEIVYEARYDQQSEPKLCKVVKSADGEESVTSLRLANRDELPNVSDDVVWQHMENLVDYIKISATDIHLVDRGMMPDNGWPVLGWPVMAKMHEEATQWWVYLTYKDEHVEVIHNVYV